jgi:hypothetical protein
VEALKGRGGEDLAEGDGESIATELLTNGWMLGHYIRSAV